MVLLDRIPDEGEWRYTPYPLPEPEATDGQAGPDVLYVAVHTGGLVDFMADMGDGQGCNGEPFDLRLVDGTSRTVVGPYSSSADTVAWVAPQLDVHRADVSVFDDPDQFHHPYGGGRTAHLTTHAAARAQQLAARRGRPTAPFVGLGTTPPAWAASNRNPTRPAMPPADPTGNRPPRR